MRERRSVNSQDARSIIDSASLELMISCSIVSSSTRLSFAWRLGVSGRSPGRVADTSPLRRAPRSIEVMPCSQCGAALCSSATASRRRTATAGSATLLSSTRAPWSTACTTAGRPASSPSTYERLACWANAVGLAGVGMGE